MTARRGQDRPKPPRGRADPGAPGRPAPSDRRDVYRQLMEATEATLSSGSFASIKVRDIATAAGVNPAMINYYFGGKLGLFAALIRFVYNNWLKGLEKIERRIGDPACDPVAELVALIAATFYRHPRVLQLVRNEYISGDSSIRRNFKENFTSRNARALRRLIAAGIATGRFDPAVNISFTAYMVAVAAVQPASIGRDLTISYDIEPEVLAGAEWRAFLTRLLSGLLLEPSHSGGGATPPP